MQTFIQFTVLNCMQHWNYYHSLVRLVGLVNKTNKSFTGWGQFIKLFSKLQGILHRFTASLPGSRNSFYAIPSTCNSTCHCCYGVCVTSQGNSINDGLFKWVSVLNKNLTKFDINSTDTLSIYVQTSLNCNLVKY